MRLYTRGFWTFWPFSPKNASMTPSMSSGPVLVVQLARFGDLIQTRRLIRSLLAESPVHLLVDGGLTELARLLYPEVTVHGIPAHASGAGDVWARIRRDVDVLAGTGFRRVYSLNFSGLSFALATLFDPETVRGYRVRAGQRLADFWPSQLMRWSARRAEAGINLVDAWGLYAPAPLSPAEVNPAAVARGGGLGVVMSGQNARRSLPPEILAPMVRAARNRTNGPVHLFGTARDRRAARELASLLPQSLRREVHDLTGGTDWPGLLEAVRGLDLLLSPDTGTAHLAAYLGVPVLGFFLSSAWCHETGPYGAGHLAVQAVCGCAPCLETRPCPASLMCRAPLIHPAVLRFISGCGGAELPEHVAVMSSGFDRLGLVYTPVAGEDPFASRRAGFRALASGLAGLGGGETGAAQEWMREKDWMLPR